MKLASAWQALHLARAQAEVHPGAPADRQLSFETACLWYLNQTLDAIVAAIREHHGLRGAGEETQTLNELSRRDLPSAAADECFAWVNWSACRKALRPAQVRESNAIASVDEDKARITEARTQGFMPWVIELEALCQRMQTAYAEF